VWKSCFSKTLYKGRNAIERMFCRLKDCRRLATAEQVGGEVRGRALVELTPFGAKCGRRHCRQPHQLDLQPLHQFASGRL
jgi:transposase